MEVGHPLVEARKVELFINDSLSDQSTCIYVDSSLNSSFSELNSSELNSSELHSLSSISSNSFSINDVSTDSAKKLKFYYINADCLLNKIGELEVLISIENPDIIIVTEVFTKNLKSANIDRNEFKIHGFSCYTCPVSDSSKGVAIYIRDTIKADYCYSLNKTNFKESV